MAPVELGQAVDFDQGQPEAGQSKHRGAAKGGNYHTAGTAATFPTIGHATATPAGACGKARKAIKRSYGPRGCEVPQLLLPARYGAAGIKSMKFKVQRSSSPVRPNPIAQAERQRQATRARPEVRCTFSQPGPWRPTVVARLAFTLGRTNAPPCPDYSLDTYSRVRRETVSLLICAGSRLHQGGVERTAAENGSLLVHGVR